MTVDEFQQLIQSKITQIYQAENIQKRSPFAEMANALLTFVTITDRYSEDEYGQPINQEVPYEVVALLKPAPARTKRDPGIDINQESLTGFLVAPLTLPDKISLNSAAKIQLIASFTRIQTGVFTLQSDSVSPYLIKSGVDEANKIKGVMRRDR